MHFTAGFVSITAALLTTVGAMTAPEVVANINIITGQSQALQAPANSINLLSGPLFLIGQGPFPQIVVGFSQIITTVTDDIQAMQGQQPFSVMSDEQSILDAFTTFVEVHQELLNILIGKAGILNDLPLVGPPVAQVLRSLEGVVDTIAFGLIAAVPDVSAPFTTQKNALDVTIGQAIAAYTPAV
ncbi:UVI-1 protein [Hyaloscypha hepaticicola]|uniref:UVI-1 protein n=1 Tax=Hyaloscypha hepaticicola TaxID=2082293 RepID=A0A2J6PDW6_9HELO|nr:UVI-1 protein [Hyaloscypha hepaticicola]